MAVVLCTGIDQSLMATRRMLLEAEGHSVIGAMDIRGVEQACKWHHIEIVVLGQTIRPTEKRRLAGIIRQQCPTAKILELFTAAIGRSVETADDSIDMSAAEPADFVKRVSALATPKPS